MESTVFKVKRDIGDIKKGDKVIVISVARCKNCVILIRKLDSEIYQKCTADDLKKVSKY